MTLWTNGCYKLAVNSFLRIAGSTLAVLTLLTPAWAQEELLPVPGKEPIKIKADRLEYLRDENQFMAEGSVEVTQGNIRLSSERAELNNVTKRLTAVGNVRLEDGESVMTADRVEYDINSREGTLHHGTLFVKESNVFVRAERIDKQGGDRYRLKEATLTTCEIVEGEDPLWQFHLGEARVEVEGYMKARDVSFEIKGVPVFYTPYLWMPVKTKRQTGLLFPRVGYNSKEGIKYNQDIFWVLSASQDATISLDYRSSHGIGGDLEYRYRMSRRSGGEARFRYFSDREEDDLRIEGRWIHRQILPNKFQARVDLHLVNDIDHFRDLSEITNDRVRNTLESTFLIDRRWDNHYFYFLTQYTKDLIPREAGTPRRDPVQKLPEVAYQLQPYPVPYLPLYFDVQITGTNFF